MRSSPSAAPLLLCVFASLWSRAPAFFIPPPRPYLSASHDEHITHPPRLSLSRCPVLRRITDSGLVVVVDHHHQVLNREFCNKVVGFVPNLLHPSLVADLFFSCVEISLSICPPPPLSFSSARGRVCPAHHISFFVRRHVHACVLEKGKRVWSDSSICAFVFSILLIPRPSTSGLVRSALAYRLPRLVLHGTQFSSPSPSFSSEDVFV